MNNKNETENEIVLKPVLPLIMSWEPKEDITTYELARCLSYIGRNYCMPWEIDESLSHFRHFKIINPNE